MPTENEFTADPDGQAVMNMLTGLDVQPREAYNATQAVRNMSGREVIARIDVFEATTNARIDALEASTTARISALEASTTAQIDALEASTTARIDALEASTTTQLQALEFRLDAQSTQIDMLAWGVGATFTMVMALVAIGVINLVTSKWPRGRDGTVSPSAE